VLLHLLLGFFVDDFVRLYILERSETIASEYCLGPFEGKLIAPRVIEFRWVSNSRRTPRLVLEAAPRATSVPRSLHLRRGAGLHGHSVPAQATLLVHGHDPSLARSLACSLASSLARWLSRSCLLACCYAPRHAAELLRRVPPLLPPFPHTR